MNNGKSPNRTSLVLLGIGSVVGAGIFSILGQAVSAAGPAVVASMVLVGLAALLVAVQYAELASAYPVAGSAYTFAYVAFGELCGWLVGWNLTLDPGQTQRVVLETRITWPEGQVLR